MIFILLQNIIGNKLLTFTTYKMWISLLLHAQQAPDKNGRNMSSVHPLNLQPELAVMFSDHVLRLAMHRDTMLSTPQASPF